MNIQKDTKDALAVVTAVGMLIFGAGLTLAGFVIEPVGMIDDSVLWVLGQALLYAGGIFGIGMYTKRRLDDMEDEIRRRQYTSRSDNEEVTTENSF